MQTIQQGRYLQQNIKLYPWFQFCRSLLFWQAIWFLYFQDVLSAGEAILLIVIFDVTSAVLEVPSGYLSDRIGRRITLILALCATMAGCLMIGLGTGFYAFALGQVLLAAGVALNSGTDSALLYDSLLETGEERDVAYHEVRAWRFTFSALAISAFVGGFVALSAAHVTFLLSALSCALGIALMLQFREPDRESQQFKVQALAERLQMLRGYLRDPALAWLFVLAVSMYVFSHVPFVFGQPFINQVMGTMGLGEETPAVSGGITASMMVISVAAGWIALPLGKRLGTAGILLLALAMQILLISVLMLSVHPIALAFLLLRMVPDAFAKPFILARIQPRIDSAYRATYLSLQSLFGRLGLGLTLFLTTLIPTTDGALKHSALSAMLLIFVVAGVCILLGLFVTRQRLIEGPVVDAERVQRDTT